MSKFCQTCGKPLADGMRFCEACGAPAPAAAPQKPVYQQAPQQPVYQQAPAAPVQPANKVNFDLNKIFDQVKLFANGVVNRCKVDKKFMISCCAIAAAVLLVIILAIVLLAKPAYTAPIDTYISVLYKGKASKIKNLAPAAYWEYMEEEEDTDVDEFIDDFEDEWDDFIDEMEDEYGKNIRVTYKVEKVKDLSDKKVEKIAEALEEQYDIDENSVKAAKELDLEITIKGSEDDDDEDAEFTVVKIGSKWYMINYYESGDRYRVYFLGSLT